MLILQLSSVIKSMLSLWMCRTILSLHKQRVAGVHGQEPMEEKVQGIGQGFAQVFS